METTTNESDRKELEKLYTTAIYKIKIYDLTGSFIIYSIYYKKDCFG